VHELKVAIMTRRVAIGPELIMLVVALVLAIAIPLSTGHSPLNVLSIVFVGMYVVSAVAVRVKRARKRKASE
jgi:hypothetical protein